MVSALVDILSMLFWAAPVAKLLLWNAILTALTITALNGVLSEHAASHDAMLDNDCDGCLYSFWPVEVCDR